MQNSRANIKEIRNTTITGIACQFLPMYLLGLITPRLQNVPGYEAIAFLVSILSLIIVFLGYGLCWIAADKYVAYKGYKNYFYIYSILNIVGLCFLFLLTKKSDFSQDNIEPFNQFKIASIFASYLLIPMIIVPIMLTLAIAFAGIEGFEDYYENNKNFSTFSELIIGIALTWYFIKEFNKAKINYKHILGSLKRINFKLPIGLAIIEYLFVSGSYPIILYGLSFIFPKYVESQLNHEYATTPISWIFFSISALIYAPIMEEFFFRGIIFQKVAITKGFLNASIVSAIVFALIHFRFDVISLFLFGVVSVLLYFKTKQLTTSIIYHFVYNFIVVVRRMHYQLFSNADSSAQTTIAEFQQIGRAHV